MRFQLLSDLHLERHRGSIPNIVPRASCLILAGDIGYPTEPHFREFMTDVVGKFSKVFYIPGNHEYYCTRNTELLKPDVDILIDELAKEIGFVNLNGRTYVMEDGTKLIGATLWTECTPETYHILASTMNDYRWIYETPTRPILPIDTGRWFSEDSNFIESELLKDTSRKIVITHHLPSPKFIHREYQGNPINCGFCTNIEHLFTDQIAAWVCGHTHRKMVSEYGSTKLLVNPVGYPGENSEVDMEFCFEV